MPKEKPIDHLSQITPLTHRKFGWKRDIPDVRDFLFAVQRPDKVAKPIPRKVDLRFVSDPLLGMPTAVSSEWMPEPYDQGDSSSCTGNALAGACEYVLRKQNMVTDFPPSRLFIYYNERYIENSVDEDSGAMIRDGIKSLKKLGVCHEETWPFDTDKITAKPSRGAYKEAQKYKISSYMRLSTLDEMRGCLADGYPFTLGMSVYESFESNEMTKTGILKIPLPNERLIGGHAVLVVGYDDDEHRFLIRNSWGSKWGQKGYFTAPYAFVASPQYSSDFWTIRKIPEL